MSKSRPAPMQGGGCYNDNARLQAGGGAHGLPFIARAFEDMPLDGGPVVVADYGSAEGRNSLAPVAEAVREIRARLGPHAPISVVHTDQPDNDFSSLFRLLRDGDGSYLREDKNVFASAIGRSFFEQIFPDKSVTFGWCSFAIHWLSGAPVERAGHMWGRMTPPEVRRAFAERSAADWKLFLGHRARELKPGGCLVVVQPTLAEDEPTTFPELMERVQAELDAMHSDGALSGAELARMVVLLYERYASDTRAPFSEGHFMGLRLKDDSVSELPDPFWQRYQDDGDAEALARNYVGFFQAPFMPSLLAALDAGRDAASRQAFAERLKAGLQAGILANPVPLMVPLAVHTTLLEKR